VSATRACRRRFYPGDVTVFCVLRHWNMSKTVTPTMTQTVNTLNQVKKTAYTVTLKTLYGV